MTSQTHVVPMRRPWKKSHDGVALNDWCQRCQRCQQAIEMDSDHMFHLNFAITLFNHGELAEAMVET